MWTHRLRMRSESEMTSCLVFAKFPGVSGFETGVSVLTILFKGKYSVYGPVESFPWVRHCAKMFPRSGFKTDRSPRSILPRPTHPTVFIDQNSAQKPQTSTACKFIPHDARANPARLGYLVAVPPPPIAIPSPIVNRLTAPTFASDAPRPPSAPPPPPPVP